MRFKPFPVSVRIRLGVPYKGSTSLSGKSYRYTDADIKTAVEASDTIALEIHHIDGVRFNNVKSNLQILCPNCHSFTDN